MTCFVRFYLCDCPCLGVRVGMCTLRELAVFATSQAFGCEGSPLSKVHLHAGLGSLTKHHLRHSHSPH